MTIKIKKRWVRKRMLRTDDRLSFRAFHATKENMLNPADMPGWVRAASNKNVESKNALRVNKIGRLVLREAGAWFIVPWGSYLVPDNKGDIHVWPWERFEAEWEQVEVRCYL